MIIRDQKIGQGKLLNRRYVKLSYSYCLNRKSIITRGQYQESRTSCNSRDPGSCPLDQRCMIKSNIYEAEVTETLNNNTTDKKAYIGLCEEEFKTRYTKHIASFRHKDKNKVNNLANETPHMIMWKIIEKSIPNFNGSNKCRLCLSERAQILFRSKISRSEIFTGSKHMYKYILKN
ncbi:Hypothetical predicted protein [Octopus vulgaris]|uniref:Uncharacterized protein n=1 Tax=Octopus vulgaris TaxID=6645 RepID=A0AA36BQ56_OCTVU|nr:Hypothetical predicted protein [Octopus vulgaris]